MTIIPIKRAAIIRPRIVRIITVIAFGYCFLSAEMPNPANASMIPPNNPPLMLSLLI